MRILVFVKTFANPTLTFIYNEVSELAKLHEVMVITCERKNKDLFPFDNVVEIPFITNSLQLKIQTKLQYLDLLWAFKSLSFKRELESIIEGFKPDVIHTHFGFESWFFLENYSVSDIPIFISFHGFDASHKLNSPRYRKALISYLKQPNITPIFVSHFMKKHVEKATNQNFLDAKILYYGTDIDFFTRKNYQKTSTFTFLQVSSFVEKKGHEFTIKAFAELLRHYPNSDSKKLKLILAGEGYLKPKMQQLAALLGIKEYVEFPGLVNKVQAKELMEQANAFVHHSVVSGSVGDMEGIPNALMEAMAMELPILSTLHSGIPELVEDGVHGFLVKERDIKTYHEKMFEILNWEYKPTNRAKVCLFFEKRQHAQQLTEYYAEKL